MSAVDTWQQFFLHSLATRLEPEAFSSYLDILKSQPLSTTHISELFLRPTDYNAINLDPRVPKYIQVLLNADLVTVPSILRALRKYSTYGGLARLAEHESSAGGLPHIKSEDQDGEEEGQGSHQIWENSYATEEMLFYRLAKHISSGHAPRNAQESVELILISIQWMGVVSSAQQSAHSLLGLVTPQADDMNAQSMALATLMVAVVENRLVSEALSNSRAPKGTAKDLAKALANFIPPLLQSSPQIAARLEMFRTQTLVDIQPPEKKEKGVLTGGEIDDILDEGMRMGIESIVVQDLPILNSRAGLYIYINALLVGRPLIDDNIIFAYLHNRYQGDIQTTIVDLILATFDVLANATFRNEKQQATTILRSFLINKVPLLLVTLSASLFPPLTAEYCITEALTHVDTNAFPTLSSMFDESSSGNLFSDSVRQDFCFACCLHGLIAESSLETLLGDVPMQSLPAGGRYDKLLLVQQILMDPQKVEGLIDELEHMDGNVGAVSQAIVDAIGRLCASKETMSLKTLCLFLVKKPSSLDVMLVFDKPTTILQPICDLLDNWRYDEDQGEYQPVYEEFGCILLLVLLFTHRYGLTATDLNLQPPSSFVAKLLNQGHLSRALDELTPQEQSHMDGWIRGLFDNESGGLGDELMSSCPPQDFYLLVPTLFHHIVLACATKNLSDESLKGGLEYLVDTFLLTSLVPSITWLSSHLWEYRGDANAVLQILSALITNAATMSNNNSDASQMLNAIVNIIAKNLEHSLRWLQRAEPQRQDVEPLSRAIRPNLGWERRGASDHVELEGWTGTSGGGLTIAVKHTLTALTTWALHPALNIHPAVYTHRQILVALKLLGAKHLLGIILEEIKTQTDAGHGSLILDIATSLICAPDAENWDDTTHQQNILHHPQMSSTQRRLTLRQILKSEVDEAPKLHRTTPSGVFQAETLVRLYRKVEAQCLMPQQQQQQELEERDLVNSVLEEAIIAAGDIELVDGMGMGGEMELELEEDFGGGIGLMGGEEDLFGGDGMGDGMGF